MKLSTLEKIQNGDHEDETGKLFTHKWQPKKKLSPGQVHYGWVKLDGKIYAFKTFGFHDSKTFDIRIREVNAENVEIVKLTEKQIEKQSQAEILAQDFACLKKIEELNE